MPKSRILEVKDLQVDFKQGKSWKTIIHKSTFSIFKNEILGIVGESGSGKSITSLAIMGLLPTAISRIPNGSVVFEGRDLLGMDEDSFRAIRGNEISMIFQEPMSSLNPSMRCGDQVEEVLREHTRLRGAACKEEVLLLFAKVKLPNPEEVYKKYPHQISGGQKQRVMIAMALACKPKLLIADEPTTALDVTVQKEIILLLKELQAETQMSILFITHDLSLISEIAQRVMVMYQGNIVEQGDTKEIFTKPKEQYSKALINSRPSMDFRLHRLPTIADFMNQREMPAVVTDADRELHLKQLYGKAPLLRVIDVKKEYVNSGKWFSKSVFRALDGVSLEIYEGETLGLVGESGCGKSTLGNVILQLDKATSGKIYYRGQDITTLAGASLRALRKNIQIIFQDPYSSLNPRMTVGEAIMEPMKVHQLYESDAVCKEKALEILNSVGLEALSFDRYPHEFSGGQRQRIGIARTIAVQPELIICDESVSALDISVQAQVLNLLNDLKDDYGFTYLFISHDLAVVKYMSDQVIVMNKGKIEERGEADALYKNPQTAYTQKLIAAIPKN